MLEQNFFDGKLTDCKNCTIISVNIPPTDEVISEIDDTPNDEVNRAIAAVDTDFDLTVRVILASYVINIGPICN